MAPEEKELLAGLISTLKEMREDAEFKGWIKAKLETTVTTISEVKAAQCKLEEKLDEKMGGFAKAVTELRVRVAGWSAIYASAATILMWLVMNVFFKKP